MTAIEDKNEIAFDDDGDVAQNHSTEGEVPKIDDKHISVPGIDSRVYGNDESVYLLAELDKVTVTGGLSYAVIKGADEVVMFTLKNTDYSIYANRYDPENGNIISTIGFGATIYKLENDEMSIICDIYTPVDGDTLGEITYTDGTVEEISYERQIEINAEIDSIPRPPIAEGDWIPMNPETVEEYFGTM